MLPRKDKGFTLVELLVVIAIIAALAGIILPVVIGQLSKGGEMETKTLIIKLKGAIDSYCNAFGEYPPTSMREFSEIRTTNGINDGIESVAACLGTRERGHTPFNPDDEKFYGNTDSDKIPPSFNNNWVYKNNAAREFIDSWGNPLVYIRGSDFDNFQSHMKKIRLADGTTVQVSVPKAETSAGASGNRPGEFTFIIYSFGANGKDDKGGRDDITSWKSGK